MQQGIFVVQPAAQGKYELHYTSPVNATAYISPDVMPLQACEMECEKLNTIKKSHALDELIRRSWYLKDVDADIKVQ